MDNKFTEGDTSMRIVIALLAVFLLASLGANLYLYRSLNEEKSRVVELEGQVASSIQANEEDTSDPDDTEVLSLGQAPIELGNPLSYIGRVTSEIADELGLTYYPKGSSMVDSGWSTNTEDRWSTDIVFASEEDYYVFIGGLDSDPLIATNVSVRFWTDISCTEEIIRVEDLDLLLGLFNMPKDMKWELEGAQWVLVSDSYGSIISCSDGGYTLSVYKE